MFHVKLALPVLECIDFVGELSGVVETAYDVVVEVAKSQGDSAKVFESSVDCFYRVVRDSSIKIRQDVTEAFVQAAA